MLILAAALPKTTFDLQFLTLSEPGDLAAEAEAMGIPVHVLGLSRDSCRGLSLGCLTETVAAVRAYIRLTRDIDVVDAWLVPAYTFAGTVQPLARVPVLLAGRRSALDVHRTRTWTREAAGRFAMHAVKAVVANSQAAADQAISIERIDPARVHVIRNAVVPVQATDTDRVDLRKAWGFAHEDVVIGCVGNFKEGKGQELLLEVATDLRGAHSNLRYCFVGEGPLRNRLESEIHERGLDGTIALHSGERDARHLYNAFDITVQASDSEGMPNVVLEAAAAGQAIVATAVGGTAEVLTSEHDGLLVAKGDRSGIGRAIVRLATDPDLRRRLGRAAEERSREFSPERLAEETASLYLSLADKLRS